MSWTSISNFQIWCINHFCYRFVVNCKVSIVNFKLKLIWVGIQRIWNFYKDKGIKRDLRGIFQILTFNFKVQNLMNNLFCLQVLSHRDLPMHFWAVSRLDSCAQKTQYAHKYSRFFQKFVDWNWVSWIIYCFTIDTLHTVIS